MKFSFIVCCYNGEPYVNKCLTSLLKQTYKNFEIIFVNDGSTDNSLKEVHKHKTDKIVIIDQENKGLSFSRNIALTKITGDYFLFIDIDDYVREDMLEILNKHLTTQIDMIKYNYFLSYDNHNDLKETNYSNIILDGDTAFKVLLESKIPFEMACIYCYSKAYWLKNEYQFAINKYHEDFGLIPYTIIKADKVLLLNDPLYYYYQSNNSITRNKDKDINKKKAFDTLSFFNLYKNKVTNNDFMSFMANAVYSKLSTLDESDKIEYAHQIKEDKVIDYMRDKKITQKLKKMIYRHNLKKY